MGPGTGNLDPNHCHDLIKEKEDSFNLLKLNLSKRFRRVENLVKVGLHPLFFHQVVVRWRCIHRRGKSNASCLVRVAWSGNVAGEG